jgi:hypothetical protein
LNALYDELASGFALGSTEANAKAQAYLGAVQPVVACAENVVVNIDKIESFQVSEEQDTSSVCSCD